MKLNYYGKKMEIYPALRETADKKLGKLGKYFQDEVDGNVTFSTIGNFKTVEVTIRLPKTILRAEETTDDMYTSIDRVVDSLESQIRKYKTKLQKRYNQGDTIRFENVVENETTLQDKDEVKIARVKRFGLKPMSPEEAVLQMELLRHDFFVFLDGETNEINVVYKRKKGDYGLIAPEA